MTRPDPKFVDDLDKITDDLAQLHARVRDVLRVIDSVPDDDPDSEIADEIVGAVREVEGDLSLCARDLRRSVNTVSDWWHGKACAASEDAERRAIAAGWPNTHRDGF